MDITIDTVLERSRVVPVASIPDATYAVAIGEALMQGGVQIIEVTLRTRDALAAIEALRRELPDLLVGAGTVWTAHDWVLAEEAGAQFIVSPGSPPELVASARRRRLPYLPGAQTPTEVASLVASGYTAAKFFPAGPAGGVSALKAMSAVFPGIRFCPTGGISLDTAPQYLALGAVPCVGGSWLLPREAVDGRDWSGIAELARGVREL
ncbi:MAG: bifunctional 4-hydroxy-2-oxoglutarate aldolase/2-dehydro-3-deoxy-phosphogluconate aldolase [Pseudomonadota bacterium]